MPVILRLGPYRFFFYSMDGREPPHVHVERDAAAAKFWLRPVRLARSREFRPQELRRIAALVEKNETAILEAWHDNFPD